ncbi:hypothetical protein HOLleu_10624 [Holothuria leucospilota]|uniref:Uncharacterized protein n=1 Tax=Holothuria leucospilota TaxID=206669 RepID=A0A9Q1CF00_HOLLE|nr:hypothetical protein HOLleu_10624 [Holothuria leucospilota]
MFSARVLLLLVLFGAVAIIASSPLQEPSDEEEFHLSQRSLDRLFKRRQREEEHHHEDEDEDEDEDDEDADEQEARVAKLHPRSRGWRDFYRNHVKPHLHTFAGHVLQSTLSG